jgi:hypothetical protein
LFNPLLFCLCGALINLSRIYLRFRKINPNKQQKQTINSIVISTAAIRAPIPIPVAATTPLVVAILKPDYSTVIVVSLMKI